MSTLFIGSSLLPLRVAQDRGYIIAILERNGVDPKPVTYLSARGQAGRIAAVEDGRVSGAFFSRYFMFRLKKGGFRDIEKLERPDCPFPPSALFVRRETIQTKRKELRLFLRALMEATDYLTLTSQNVSSRSRSTLWAKAWGKLWIFHTSVLWTTVWSKKFPDPLLPQGRSFPSLRVNKRPPTSLFPDSPLSRFPPTPDTGKRFLEKGLDKTWRIGHCSQLGNNHLAPNKGKMNKISDESSWPRYIGRLYPTPC